MSLHGHAVSSPVADVATYTGSNLTVNSLFLILSMRYPSKGSGVMANM